MRILVADDHPLYREALRAQLERIYPDAVVDEVVSFDDVVRLAGSGDAAYRLFLVDFHMPGMSAAAMARLVAANPTVPLAVISGTANAADVRAAIHAGARGFIPKTATGSHLGHALQLLLAGGTSVPTAFLAAGDSSATESAASSPTAPPWLEKLTNRERDVLKAVARGLSNKEVGRELGLAEVTIKLHLSGIFRKIGARSRAEAAVIATKANLA